MEPATGQLVVVRWEIWDAICHHGVHRAGARLTSKAVQCNAVALWEDPIPSDETDAMQAIAVWEDPISSDQTDAMPNGIEHSDAEAYDICVIRAVSGGPACCFLPAFDCFDS